MVVSNSDRCAFKNCRRKWDFGSPNRQNLRIVKKQKPLWLGSLVHDSLERYYEGKFTNAHEAYLGEVEKLDPQEAEDFAEEVELAGIMLYHYSLVYPGIWSEPFEVLSTELPFQIPLNNKGDVFAGTIDGVIRWKDSRAVSVLEHKTFSQAKDPLLHGIDDQTSIYPPALNLLIQQGKVPGTTKDDFCKTVLYNGLYKKVPGKIKLLADGSLSNSKAMYNGLTPQWLEHEMEKRGINSEIPLDKKEIMWQNVKRFFPRFEIHRGVVEQNQAVQRLLAEFKEMSREDLVLYHNPTTECSWKCSFLPLCEATNSGVDLEIMIKNSYEKAPSRGQAYEEGK